MVTENCWYMKQKKRSNPGVIGKMTNNVVPGRNKNGKCCGELVTNPNRIVNEAVTVRRDWRRTVHVLWSKGYINSRANDRWWRSGTKISYRLTKMIRKIVTKSEQILGWFRLNVLNLTILFHTHWSSCPYICLKNIACYPDKSLE